ncbi:response regulator [Bacteroidota bacterium]
MESIVIVDDDISLCKVLSEELNEVGYDSHYVTSADELFEYIDKGNSIDLILLDLKMPEKDGFYVLQILQGKDIDVKVIVLTAYADVKSAIDSARLGADDFISKPYDFDELLITIRRVLQKKENEN